MVNIKDLFKDGEKALADLNEEERAEFNEKIRKLLAPSLGSYALPEQTLAMLKQAVAPMSQGAISRAEEILKELGETYRKALGDTSRGLVDRMPKIEPPTYYPNKPKINFPVPQLRNYAEEKIESILKEIEERQKNLSPDKVLRVYVAFGAFTIAVTTFTPKDDITIEVQGFDENYNLVSIIADYRQLLLMFREENAPQTDNGTVH